MNDEYDGLPSDDPEFDAARDQVDMGCGPFIPPGLYSLLVLGLVLLGLVSGGSSTPGAVSTPASAAHRETEQSTTTSSTSTSTSTSTTTTSLPLFTPPGAGSTDQPSSGGSPPPAGNPPSGGTPCAIPNTLSYTANGSTTSLAGTGSDQDRSWSFHVEDSSVTFMNVSISGLVPHTQCGMEYHMYVSGANSYALACGGGPTLATNVDVHAPDSFNVEIKVVASCT